MMHSLKTTEFTVYVEGTDQELGVANIEITPAINTQPGEPIDIPGIFSPQTLELIECNVNPVVLNDLMRGWGDLTPEQAQEAIAYIAEHKTPIRYWALKHLFTIAGMDINPYKWVPVIMDEGETMEHAFRRVQLGSSMITDSVEVVIVPPDQMMTTTFNTLF